MMFIKIMGVAAVCGLLAVPATGHAENREYAAIVGGIIGGALAGSVP